MPVKRATKTHACPKYLNPDGCGCDFFNQCEHCLEFSEDHLPYAGERKCVFGSSYFKWPYPEEYEVVRGGK